MYPKNELFTLLQIHFHWRGSEHFVDGKKFAGEMHLVFQSKTNTKQFSVIGFMMKVRLNINDIQKIVSSKIGFFKILKFDKRLLIMII